MDNVLHGEHPCTSASLPSSAMSGLPANLAVAVFHSGAEPTPARKRPFHPFRVPQHVPYGNITSNAFFTFNCVSSTLNRYDTGTELPWGVYTAGHRRIRGSRRRKPLEPRKGGKTGVMHICQCVLGRWLSGAVYVICLSMHAGAWHVCTVLRLLFDSNHILRPKIRSAVVLRARPITPHVHTAGVRA
jgi:hypothetical protein